MITCVIRRDDEPKVIQMTQENIIRELSQINGSEMLLEDSWTEGLRKVRTPYVCLLEADCVLSASYLSSNFGLMKKASTGVGSYHGGGYTKLAMLSSCLGVSTFANRIYNYHLEKIKDDNLKVWAVGPNRDKASTKLYESQIGFVPGAIIRFNSIKDVIDELPWDLSNVIEMSTQISFYFWNTNRRIQVNPNTTYVSNLKYLETNSTFDIDIPDRVQNIFMQESLV